MSRMGTEIINMRYTGIDQLVLVYQDSDGALREQPGDDLQTAGTLIDDDTGVEMELVGFKLKD